MHLFTRPLLAAIMVLALLLPASAHPMPSTLIELDVHDKHLDAELSIPLLELALALRWEPEGDPQERVAERSADVTRYLLEHLQITAPDGAPWQISIGPITTQAADPAGGVFAKLVTEVTATPPPGASTRDFSLAYDAVIEGVATHSALVAIRRDWMASVPASDAEPQQVGVIQMNRVTGEIPPMAVQLVPGSLWTGFLDMVQLGISHIAEGTDHLLFLLTLLLPAPLVTSKGRWQGHRDVRASLAGIAGIVTAFTLGHSVSLVLASLLHVAIPQQPVEVLIAVTILISACHAIRPLFPGREALVAGLFGLVHGMAFSFTLAEMNLSDTEMAVSLLGFNLGIEVLQLAVVTVAIPVLMVLAQTTGYALLRTAGAIIAVLAALGWTTARLGYANPLATLADGLGAAALPVLGVLGISAMVVAMSSRFRRRPPQLP